MTTVGSRRACVEVEKALFLLCRCNFSCVNSGKSRECIKSDGSWKLILNKVFKYAKITEKQL